MRAGAYSLGLDLSTQSISATVIDLSAGGVVADLSLNYADDPRLNRYGMDFETFIIPPRAPGEADQNPFMFLAGLDALFSDLKSRIDVSRIAAVNCSAQQHGHVYLASGAWEKAVSSLAESGSGGKDLRAHFASAFSLGTCPIWKTADTASEAADLTAAAGGRDRMIQISGSDSPLRFSGAVVRRVGLRYPAAYEGSSAVRLLSAFLAALLSANPEAPTDWGNAAGMSLMDYRSKEWAPSLLEGCAKGLTGGTRDLLAKLGKLDSPLSKVGNVARYFIEKFGLSEDAVVFVGSGDNPQTKVLGTGDLLSLGTSFVNMVSTQGGTDPKGAFNAMYDGLGRPFMFGCRTNGALVWDRVRAQWGIEKRDYAKADACLAATPTGSNLAIWQPDAESFPRSAPIPLTRLYEGKPSFEKDYAGVIDSSLALVYMTSKVYSAGTELPLAVTGGPTGSVEILKRIADIWNRPVKAIGKAGASLGAACAGAAGLGLDAAVAASSCLAQGQATLPGPGAAALRAEGGYLKTLEAAFARATG